MKREQAQPVVTRITRRAALAAGALAALGRPAIHSAAAQTAGALSYWSMWSQGEPGGWNRAVTGRPRGADQGLRPRRPGRVGVQAAGFAGSGRPEGGQPYGLEISGPRASGGGSASQQ